MKNIKLCLALFILLTVIYTPFVYALPDCGNISGEYKYGNESLSNANVSVYLVADIIDENVRRYEFTEGFKEFELNVNELNYSELEVYASNLKRAIKSGNVQKVATAKTDANGKFTFDKCLHGLYLLDVEDLKVDKNLYKSLPSVIAIPTVSEDGTKNNEIFVNVKSEKTLVEDSTGNGTNSSGSNIRVPNTYDEIIVYVALFIVSLVLLVILICYIYYKKKGKDKDEKNK